MYDRSNRMISRRELIAAPVLMPAPGRRTVSGANDLPDSMHDAAICAVFARARIDGNKNSGCEYAASGFNYREAPGKATPVMRTDLTMPMAFENIFEPLRARPKTPEGVDALAQRGRAYVGTVIAALEAHLAKG